jgi:hypothetical protein
MSGLKITSIVEIVDNGEPRIHNSVIRTFNVKELDELDYRAAEQARDRYREHHLDYDWYEFVFEDAKRMGALMGIEVDRIYFSGFASQGDGACFEGSYSYRKGGYRAVLAEAPKDETLHKIAKDLQDEQKRGRYQLCAHVKHRGHYSHEHCTEINVSFGDTSDWTSPEQDEAISEVLRDFMHWIYRQLEAEYDYQMSDEAIDESMEVNEMRFDKDGNVV